MTESVSLARGQVANLVVRLLVGLVAKRETDRV